MITLTQICRHQSDMLCQKLLRWDLLLVVPQHNLRRWREERCPVVKKFRPQRLQVRLAKLGKSKIRWRRMSLKLMTMTRIRILISKRHQFRWRKLKSKSKTTKAKLREFWKQILRPHHVSLLKRLLSPWLLLKSSYLLLLLKVKIRRPNKRLWSKMSRMIHPSQRKKIKKSHASSLMHANLRTKQMILVGKERPIRLKNVGIIPIETKVSWQIIQPNTLHRNQNQEE